MNIALNFTNTSSFNFIKTIPYVMASYLLHTNLQSLKFFLYLYSVAHIEGKYHYKKKEFVLRAPLHLSHFPYDNMGAYSLTVIVQPDIHLSRFLYILLIR